MNKFARTPAAVAVCLLATAAFNATAQTTPEAAAPAKNADALTGSTFSTPSNTNALTQTTSAPGAYDLAGIGRRDADQETILTAPVAGVPLRFENGIFVFASALAGIGHNDNVVGTATGAISSTVFSVQPRVVAELKKSGDRYTLLYSGNITRYSSSSEDNFVNHNITASGDNYFSARSNLGWSAGYLIGTDPRGSTDRALSSAPDKWHAPTANAVYTYGAKGAQGRIQVETSLQQKRYDNNRATTAASDVNIGAVAGRFLYRVMPRTAAVFEVRHIDSNYRLSTSTNDNTDNRYLVGVTWEAAAKTTGSFKVGRQQKNYSLRPDSSGSTFEGSVRWEPLTYSVFDLTTGRSAADSTGVGDYVVSTGTNLMWNHKWAGYLSTRATLGTVKSDYVNGGRSDNIRNFGVGVFYEIGRNMRAGLELANTRRNSNQDVFDYKRNTTFLSLEGTL